ncbi:hypothetical protein BDDG_12108 [Blastomyces dermatitidis ATCC 18188]|uniref:Restriction of telomere capping protein 4 C-terminal domain-containing protein n=1 Tax=Ajellomyces dermatitidis (strain ATCC 18188 / CBS 674.68) TaxID=653446 RepID=A0A0J9EM61_AJEDA|nr:hypothetical protein BDFG_00850 [Blastomyces dermatitidis ATCC 26199]KMW67418.1 hypothetical protein BDDG_12108 [Blastomyces dermatitidis ATCC 18188]
MSLLSKRLFRACCCEVLVPELLEMLVREDMGVDARGARRILKESNKIGKLLNLERIDRCADLDPVVIRFAAGNGALLRISPSITTRL